MGYYIFENGQQYGPFTVEQLKKRGITINTQVWREGMTQWTCAKNIPELIDIAQPPLPGSTPPPHMPYQQSTPTTPCPDNHLTLAIIATIVFFLAYILYAEVLRENTFLSRTIEIQENQKVIDTGLYGIVRHPMYFATVLMFNAMPLILGSYVSFVIFLVYPGLIAKRIRNEEEVLEEGLTGYTSYKNKVKYRLIPFVW